MPKRRNSVESLRSLKWWNPLRVRDDLPEMIAKGPAEKDLLKWVGVFFRKPTPGQFMMRIRMPNGFATSAQLRAIAETSRRIGNGVLDITTRQQIELRGFTLDTVPEIWEKLRGVDLTSVQTGMDNVRNINGRALAGLTPHVRRQATRGGGGNHREPRSATIGACPRHPPCAANRAGLPSWPSWLWADCIGLCRSPSAPDRAGWRWRW
jgi:sulfite reductase beta subunit-like hemoprotein